MCFYICSGYFNLMLNKRRPRLKDNNVSSSAQASPPEWVIAHQQAGRRVCGRLRFCRKSLSSRHRQSRSSQSGIRLQSGSLMLHHSASPHQYQLTGKREYRCQTQRGGGVVLEICLEEIFMSFYVLSLMNVFKDRFTIYNLYDGSSWGNRASFSM